MAKNLGVATTTMPVSGSVPPAARISRSGWRDPRLWIGLLLVTVSVVAGARLLAAADDTVAVWSAGADLGPGADVRTDDLVVRRVRFADRADLERYFTADSALPDELVMVRAVGAGELLPRAAVGPRDDVGMLHIPLEIEPQQVPRGVAAGSVVDVYLDGAPGRAGRSAEGLALTAVTVVDAPPLEESFAATGTRQLVVAVDETDAVAFQKRYAALDDPLLWVYQRS